MSDDKRLCKTCLHYERDHARYYDEGDCVVSFPYWQRQEIRRVDGGGPMARFCNAFVDKATDVAATIAAEREACAQVVESTMRRHPGQRETDDSGHDEALSYAAERIRARGQEKGGTL